MICAAGAIVHAQEPSDEERITPGLLRPFESLRGDSTDAEWAPEGMRTRQAIERLWRRNGWNTEADHFAKELAAELAEIPPWDPLGRLNMLSRRACMRYGLTGEKAREFNKMLFRAAGKLLVKNAPLIIRQRQEVLDVRSDGRPFSAAEVAKWSKELGPLMEDMRAVLDEVTTELEPMLDDSARRRLREDIGSFNKRNTWVNGKVEQWSRGEWKPEDWGMDEDPIQTGAGAPGITPMPAGIEVHAGAAPASQKRGAPPVPPARKAAAVPRCVPHEHMSWIGCVVEVSIRFKLDGGQMSAAESIHQEVLDRAERYVNANRETLSVVAESARATHEGYAPVRELHTELMERLNAIPTRAQRDAGKP